MLDQPASFYVWNGVLLGVLGLAVLAWLLWGVGRHVDEIQATP
jgi:hypothetical protein